jgi:hypothetical protein
MSKARAVVGETTATVGGRVIRVTIEGPEGSAPNYDGGVDIGPVSSPSKSRRLDETLRRASRTVSKASAKEKARKKARNARVMADLERGVGRAVLKGIDWLLSGDAKPEDLSDDD